MFPKNVAFSLNVSSFTPTRRIHSIHVNRQHRSLHNVAAYTMTSSSLSPLAKELFQSQVESPIFDPHLMKTTTSDDVRTAIHLAQPSTPPFNQVSTSAITDSVCKVACMVLQDSKAVAVGREEILKTFKGISEPGGDLYPEKRSDACWRDLQAFTRVVGYLCALDGDDSPLSDDGFRVLSEVYEELDVPVDAVVVGVKGIWGFATRRAAVVADESGVAAPDVCAVLDKSFAAVVSRVAALR